MVITITSESGKTKYTPDSFNLSVSDYVAWLNQDSREGDAGKHLIVDANNQPFFDVALLPMPPPSPPFYYSKTDIGKVVVYHSQGDADNVTGTFTVVAG